MLTEKYANPASFKIQTHTQLFPEISDRDFWNRARETFADEFTKELEPYEGIERKMLTASLYREFTVNGNRTNFQTIYYARRNELIRRVFIECFKDDGAQMEDILDLTWMILEETSWTLPAHNWCVPEADSLPDFKNNTLDLFLSETACTLAFVYQTVGKKLDEMSTVVCRRIKDTLERVAIDDYLKRDDYWWMGFGGEVPNNWNPWINSNVLAVAIMLEDDEAKLRQLIYKVMRSLDNYINHYPEDGACDEGAHYWNQAGLSMIECLWMISLATGGDIDVFGEDKIKNTSEYFMKVYVGRGQCINFADSGAGVPMYYATIYKFAKIMKNEKLVAFAEQLCAERKSYTMAKKEDFDTKSLRIMDYVRYTVEIESNKKSDIVPDKRYYLGSTNVMVSKAGPSANEGLFLAAKGGHNGESHNHNDMGNYIVYKNGTRFIIDSGNMTYSKITFSDRRYTLWTTRSKYHNVPLIGGCEQMPGAEYCPTDVSYSIDGNTEHFSLDIANSYENRDKIKSWVRSFTYDRDNAEITICDNFDLSSETEYELHFMTPQATLKTSDGIALTAPNGETLTISIDMSKFDFDIEEINVEDPYLKKEWGDTLYCISLKATAKEDKIIYTIK